MFDMLLWFAVVMVLFAVGDVVAKLTKARISSMFATPRAVSRIACTRIGRPIPALAG